MENINTYLELPYIGADDLENDTISGFGYMLIKPDDINMFVVARDSNEDCDSDQEWYNPEFLQPNELFDSLNHPINQILSDNFSMYSTIDHAHDEIKKLIDANKNKGKDLIIYQIIRENEFDQYVTFKVIEIIKI